MEFYFEIPFEALNLYKSEGYEDAYFTLTSCFINKVAGRSADSHGLFPNGLNQKERLITRKELEERCRKNPSSFVHSITTNTGLIK